MPLPQKLSGDKGFRADWVDEILLSESLEPVIPSKANEDRGSSNPFDRVAYCVRNMIEHLVGWLKECHRIFTRLERSAKDVLSTIHAGFIHRCLLADIT